MAQEIEITTATAIVQAGEAERIVEAYLAQLDVSARSEATYRNALRRWTAWLAETGRTLAVSRADVLAYRDQLQATSSAATVNAYLVAVRGLYSWLESERLYPNVARDVHGLKKKAAAGHDALTLDQARELLADGAATVAELRDAAMISLMLRRGLRTVEIVRADVGDIRQIDGEGVLYVQGKGHTAKDDFVVLGAAVLEKIYAYLAARGRVDDGAPLFAATGNRNAGGRMTTRSVSRIVKAAYERHGIVNPRITAHSLRHTAVTLSLKGGATVQEAQAMARHANIQTTLLYAHNLQRMEAKAERSVDMLLAG